MENKIRTKPIDFMSLKKVYFVISLAFVIPSMFALATYGFTPAIDFTGGTLLEINIPDTSLEESEIKSLAAEDFEVTSVQKTGDTSYLIRSKTISHDESIEFQNKLASISGLLVEEATTSAEATMSAGIQELRFETVGPTLGAELLRKTYFAVAIATISILLYIAYRFSEIKYGICAVLAMLHDTLILLGTFAFLGHFYGIEVDTLFVTAVLTTLSFSVHDTIVVYDRIRELLSKHKKASFLDVVNKAVAETLSRSINNSMTIIFMLLSLWLMGGETTRWFVFALLIGTIAGTYSSTFTAAPLLVLWEEMRNKKK